MRIEWSRLVRGRPVRGIAVSLVLHLLLVALVMWAGAPVARYAVKRGEPLFVELPELPEPAPAGNPAAKSPGPPAPVPVHPARAARPAESRPPRQSPRPAPPAVASRPQPALEPVRPAPQAVPAPQSPPPAPEPPKPQDMATLPAPAPTPAPAEPVPGPRLPTVAGPPAPPAAPAPASPAGPQVAAVPRGGPPAPPTVDIRSALGRGGGAGSQGGGRGGIEGEPIPLDSPDPKFSDYLDRVRRMIKERWGFPCVKNPVTRECEYKSAQLVVEFGIAKDGKVPFVNVMRSSGWPIYDDYAVNAIKLAAPFPPVPDSISKKGIPILATFNYVVDTSLTNLLR